MDEGHRKAFWEGAAAQSQQALDLSRKAYEAGDGIKALALLLGRCKALLDEGPQGFRSRQMADYFVLLAQTNQTDVDFSFCCASAIRYLGSRIGQESGDGAAAGLFEWLRESAGGDGLLWALVVNDALGNEKCANLLTKPEERFGKGEWSSQMCAAFAEGAQLGACAALGAVSKAQAGL